MQSGYVYMYIKYRDNNFDLHQLGSQQGRIYPREVANLVCSVVNSVSLRLPLVIEVVIGRLSCVRLSTRILFKL